MSWLELFFTALVINLTLTSLVMGMHRLTNGTSPWWEGGLMVALILWVGTCIGRLGTDVLGIRFDSGAMAVQTFFWAGVSSVLMFWVVGQVRWYYLHWGLDEAPDS